MRVLAVQKKTLGTPAKNLERVRRMLEDAAAPDVIVLPEIFTCPYDNSCFPVFAQEEGGEVCRELSKIAVEHHAWLVGGSVPERDGDRIYNTSYVYDREGSLRESRSQFLIRSLGKWAYVSVLTSVFRSCFLR